MTMHKFLFPLIGIILFLCCSCDKTKSPSKQQEIKSEQNNTTVYRNPADYYKSIFTKNSAKDLEKRVFTGMTITERLGKTYSYQLPNGNQIEVAYSNKNNLLLFSVETVFGRNEMYFELRNDLEMLKIREMNYLLMVFLNPDGLLHILELNNGSLTSISNFMDKYRGTLNGQEFSETDETIQKQAEEFCLQFFEKKYKPLKEELKTDDFYRIYTKALRKEN